MIFYHINHTSKLLQSENLDNKEKKNEYIKEENIKAKYLIENES